jgi:hypothetical protein
MRRGEKGEEKKKKKEEGVVFVVDIFRCERERERESIYS